jgi:hypothetical protein
MNEARIRKERLVQFSELLMKKEDLQFLQDVESGSITESEFVLSVLLHFEILSDDDVNPWKMVGCWFCFENSIFDYSYYFIFLEI